MLNMLKKTKNQLKKDNMSIIGLADLVKNFVSDVLKYREEHARTHTFQDRRLDSLEKETKRLQIRVKNLELKK